MGVDVSPELIIGKEFKSESEATRWLLEKLGKDEDWLDDEHSGSIRECLDQDIPLGLSGKEYSGYGDYEFYIGFEPDLSDRTGQNIAECWRKAVELFGEDAHVHFWARYW